MHLLILTIANKKPAISVAQLAAAPTSGSYWFVCAKPSNNMQTQCNQQQHQMTVHCSTSRCFYSRQQV
jgi:hypothetical protein